MIVVFTGPTLAVEEARPLLEADYRPPVAQGDVLSAARRKPWAIGIIDGYFERVPSVWHKEILWALSQGVHVYGAASMGALRAAELEAFGMVGVGEIFEAYRDGRLEDDDEVAVVHAGASQGLRPLSEAMVDIRATLERAISEGVLEERAGRRIESVAKSLYYPQRTYRRILETAGAAGEDGESLETLRRWLSGGRVQRKKEDARALLTLMASELGSRPEPKRVSFSFQRTEIWEHAVRHSGRGGQGSTASSGATDLLLDELRLLGRAAYRDRLSGALLRALALAEFRRRGGAVSEDALGLSVERLRLRHGLRDPEDARRWIREQGLEEDSFRAWMEEETKIEVIRTIFRSETDEQLEAELRLHGLLQPLRERQREKNLLLDTQAMASQEVAATGLSEEELLRWYFEERLKRPVPEDLDAWVRDLDLPGVDVFVQIVLREYLYRRRLSDAHAD